MIHRLLYCTVLAMTHAGTAMAEGSSGGFLGIDRFDEREDCGVFSRPNQKRVDVLALGALFGTALWQGTDTRLGLTSWRAIDAVLSTAAATEALKTLTGRPRPATNPNPNAWFQGHRNHSFPSGETAMVAALVTPYIVEYAPSNPWVWGLAAAPVYMGMARMRSQAHWLSDVLAGAAIGATSGYLASQRDKRWIVMLLPLPGGAFAGLRARF